MKRVAVFVLLGPILFVLCIWLFLHFAIRVEGGNVKYDFEVEFTLFLGLMFCCFFLALVDWVAELLVMRPWFTGAVGWVFGALILAALFNLSQPIWWWFIVKGLLVGIPALVCSWLVKRIQNRKAQ